MADVATARAVKIMAEVNFMLMIKSLILEDVGDWKVDDDDGDDDNV